MSVTDVVRIPGRAFLHLLAYMGHFVGYDAGRFDVTAGIGATAGSSSIELSPRDVRRPAQVVGKVPRSAFMTSEVWLHPSGNVAYLATEAVDDVGSDRRERDGHTGEHDPTEHVANHGHSKELRRSDGDRDVPRRERAHTRG